jgi:glycosyltransferase involved in cell wall biosynthesis
VIGNAGLIFPEGDPRALADQIERLRSDPGCWRRNSAMGRERAGIFSAERFADDFFSLLQGIRYRA